MQNTDTARAGASDEPLTDLLSKSTQCEADSCRRLPEADVAKAVPFIPLNRGGNQADRARSDYVSVLSECFLVSIPQRRLTKPY